jgi:hypothetical protein
MYVQLDLCEATLSKVVFWKWLYAQLALWKLQDVKLVVASVQSEIRLSWMITP